MTVGTVALTTLFGVAGTETKYSVLQGGGSDGANAYFVVMYKEPGDIHVTQLVKYGISSGKRLASASFGAPGKATNALGHGNDLAYDTDRALLVVPAWTNDQSTQPPNNQKTLRLIDPATLEIVGVLTADISVTNLCYVNRTFVVFSGNKLRSYDASFALKGIVGFDLPAAAKKYAPGGDVGIGQGIDCDGDYVYITRWHSAEKTNRLYVANWKGQLVAVYTANGPESENLMHASAARILYGFNTSASAGDLRRIDKFQYVVQYVAEGGTGSMATTRVLYGRNTPLRKNTFTRAGKQFAGWAAERESDGKWRYQSADRSADGWYEQGKQPSGYGYYVYGDQAIVLRSAPFGYVKMHAQWK